MNKEEKIREEVEKTLKAFDNIENIEENPYLFTRIQSEIESLQTKGKGYSLKGNILKPAILFLVLIINVCTIIFFQGSESTDTSTKQTYLSAISSEYSISHSYYSQLDEVIGK